MKEKYLIYKKKINGKDSLLILDFKTYEEIKTYKGYQFVSCSKKQQIIYCLKIKETIDLSSKDIGRFAK